MSVNVAKGEEWPLLRFFGRGILFVVKALLGAFIGGWIMGVTAGIGTIYCYAIGAWVGIPLGMFIGALVSPKVSAGDVFFTFGLSVTVWVVLAKTAGPDPEPSFMTFFYDLFPTIVGSLTATASLFVIKSIPERWKLGIGGILSSGLLAWGVVSFLIMIYSQG